MATITPLNSSSIYDEKIVRELFEQHYTPLVLFAKGYIPDLDTDKDVVQEVFLSLIESQETFNDVDNLKAYLYGTVKHKCLKYLRHEEVKRRYQKYMQSEVPDETKTYEERVLEEEVYALLIKAIQNLPEQCQKVYLLVLEGKSNQEIAYQLQLKIPQAGRKKVALRSTETHYSRRDSHFLTGILDSLIPLFVFARLQFILYLCY